MPCDRRSPADKAAGREGSFSAAGEIQSWVEANYTSTTVGSSTVYDLTT